MSEHPADLVKRIGIDANELAYRVVECTKQLAACRFQRTLLRNGHQQVLTWMRQTDSAVPMADIIKILEADLEATT